MKRMMLMVSTLVMMGVFLSPTLTFAQSRVDVIAQLSEIQDQLAVLYNRANDIVDGELLPPPVTDTSIAVPSCSTLILERNLSIGSSGSDVRALQQHLRATGVYTGPVTGYYGSLTAQGVEQWKDSRDMIRWTANADKGYGVTDEIMRALLKKDC